MLRKSMFAAVIALTPAIALAQGSSTAAPKPQVSTSATSTTGTTTKSLKMASKGHKAVHYKKTRKHHKVLHENTNEESKS